MECMKYGKSETEGRKKEREREIEKEREREKGRKGERERGRKPKVERREIGTTAEAAASRQNH